jgi:hypothetical protein
MPYIDRDQRPKYDDLIARIAAVVSEQPAERRKGHANYVITQLLRRAWGVTEPANESYSSYADIIGTLECAKLELYRRWVARYEDGAIARHGDL